MEKDKYDSYEGLAAQEAPGAFAVFARHRGPTLILAPHAGGIEPGTSESARAIAAEDHSLYLFEGIKPAGNKDLHVTSSRFDEPQCLAMLERAGHVVTVHGERRDGKVTFVGGLDEAGIDRHPIARRGRLPGGEAGQ